MNIRKLISLPVVGATLVFILFTALVTESSAQTNWVVCESIMNGTQQSFPGSCPSGWVFISH
jgi:hypothetical protein